MTSLFDPVALGDLELANRVVMAPMTRSRANAHGVPHPLAADYYAQRASAGLIVTEGVFPSPNGQGYVDTPGIWSDEQVEAWARVADAVHAARGRIVLQLMHCGRAALSENQAPGAEVVARPPWPARRLYSVLTAAAATVRRHAPWAWRSFQRWSRSSARRR